jgi:hypothetical protein
MPLAANNTAKKEKNHGRGEKYGWEMRGMHDCFWIVRVARMGPSFTGLGGLQGLTA